MTPTQGTLGARHFTGLATTPYGEFEISDLRGIGSAVVLRIAATGDGAFTVNRKTYRGVMYVERRTYGGASTYTSLTARSVAGYGDPLTASAYAKLRDVFIPLAAAFGPLTRAEIAECVVARTRAYTVKHLDEVSDVAWRLERDLADQCASDPELGGLIHATIRGVIADWCIQRDPVAARRALAGRAARHEDVAHPA